MLSILVYIIGIVSIAYVTGRILYKKKKVYQRKKVERISYLFSQETCDAEYPEHDDIQFVNRFETTVFDWKY